MRCPLCGETAECLPGFVDVGCVIVVTENPITGEKNATKYVSCAPICRDCDIDILERAMRHERDALDLHMEHARDAIIRNLDVWMKNSGQSSFGLGE